MMTHLNKVNNQAVSMLNGEIGNIVFECVLSITAEGYSPVLNFILC